jgi:TonB-dependent starch-binding outer membrane protein SusC
MKKLRLLFCFMMLCCFMNLTHAQSITVTGKVTSKTTGEPLPGASIMVKGTTTGTTADLQGNFSIQVPKKGSSLVVTYQGMTVQELIINQSASVSVQLNEIANLMNEVVVVGYGTQKKSVVTGAIASVKARDLENVPNGRIEQALQGRVSGVTVFQNSGQPGSGSTIRVRGITTFNSNGPLYVIDGVVVDGQSVRY